MTASSRPLRAVYRGFLETYGPQHWWPATSPFEVMAGAIELICVLSTALAVMISYLMTLRF